MKILTIAVVLTAILSTIGLLAVHLLGGDATFEVFAAYFVGGMIVWIVPILEFWND